MSRVNSPHDSGSIDAMAKEFAAVHEKLVELATRLKKELGAKNKISLAHQVSIDMGLLSARKLIREAHTKLDNLADERETLR